MSRRLRITLLASLSVLLTLAAAALVLVYVMLRPERFTRTLRDSARAAGLELTLTSPAHPALWPHPGVRLQGMQIFVQGQPYPLLVADSGRIVVPWHTVLGGDAAINTLQLDAPRLDLGQLRRLLDTAPGGEGKPPKLLHIGTGITIRDGALVSENKLLLKNVDMHTGPLLPGMPFTLDAQAADPSGKQQLLKLQFTPGKTADGTLALNQLHLDVRTGSKTGIRLDGRASWSGNTQLQLDLHGNLDTDHSGTYKIAVTTDDTPQAAADTLHLAIQGKAGDADVRLSPTQLTDWWQHVTGNFKPGPLPLPPVSGQINVQEVNMGSLHVKGLELSSGDSAPAAAASAKTPAASTGK